MFLIVIIWEMEAFNKIMTQNFEGFLKILDPFFNI